MFAVGPTFFSSPAGDHPPGDGLTRLQTAFAGGSSADISQYALGSGLVAGPIVVSNGLLTCPLVSGVETSLRWDDSSLGRPASTAMTYEYFFRMIEVSVNPVASISRMAMLRNVDNMGSGGAFAGDHILGFNGYSGDMNQLVLALATWYTYAAGVDAFSLPFWHVAYVYEATLSGTLSIYLNGVRIFNGGGGHVISGTSSVWLGGFSASPSATIEFKGIRVRRAQMYSGASFVPPAGPEAWGPP